MTTYTANETSPWATPGPGHRRRGAARRTTASSASAGTGGSPQLRHLVGDLAADDDHQQPGDRAERVLGQGRDGQPDRAERGHRRGQVESDQQQPQQPGAQRDRGAGQQRHRADREQDRADDQRDGRDQQAGGQAEHDDRRVLDGEQPGPAGGHGRAGSAACRGAASPAIESPGHHRDGQRQDQGEHARSATSSARNTPLPATWLEERGPAAPAVTAAEAPSQPEHDAEQHRDRGQHGQQREVARAAEDQPQLGAQQPQPGPDVAARRAAPRAAAWGGRPAQPSTSKPSPVSSTNRSSRLARGVSSPATGTSGVHELGADGLRRLAAEQRGDLPARRP